MSLDSMNERVQDLARDAARRAGTTQTRALETALERYVATLKGTEGATAVEDKHARARVIVDRMREAMVDTDGDAMRRELDERGDFGATDLPAAPY